MAAPRLMAPSLPAAFVVVVFLIVAPMWSPPAADGAGTTTHLHFFIHDILTGSSATAVQVIKGPVASAAIPGMAFGDTIVIDDALTEESSPASAAVGRAQGFYMMTSSQSSAAVLTVCANLVLTSGDYNGSTIAVMGPDDIAADVRELAVVGGTGRFRMATGYVLWKTATMNGPDATIELDVYVSATGGGSGSGSSIDSSTPVGGSSSAAVRPVGGGWVNSYIPAALVVAVVVGSYV